MPPPHMNSSPYVPPSQPAARHPPKPAAEVLAEAEQQWIFSEEELLHTPSIMDGMKPEVERETRGKGVNFIWQVGMMLKLPQLTLSTAAVFFNRFLMRHSLVPREGYKPLHHYQVAATSLFLATKVEENCRKVKELVIACCRVAQKNPNLLVDEQTKDFWKWRDTILFNEDVLLEMLCFDLTVESPYKVFFDMLKALGAEHNKKLRNAAWSFINDSCQTQLCLIVTSRTIGAAAIYCGAKHCGVAFPDFNGRPWWEVQGVRLRDVRRACNYMADIFEHQPTKDGSESIYVGLRSSEDGDPAEADTRLRSPQTPQTPFPGAGMERGASDQGVKRTRENSGASMENGVQAANGSTNHPARIPKAAEESMAVNGAEAKVEPEQPRMKRVKTEANGIETTAKADAQATGKGASKVDSEEGSEEGELEE